MFSAALAGPVNAFHWRRRCTLSPQKVVNTEGERTQLFYTSVSPAEHRLDIQLGNLVLKGRVSESVAIGLPASESSDVLFKIQIPGPDPRHTGSAPM